MPPEILALQGESLQPKGRIVLELAEDSTLANIPEIPLEDYVAQAGGATLMPGDAIVVPEDLTRTTWMKDLKDWSQIFYQFGLGAAAIKVIRD